MQLSEIRDELRAEVFYGADQLNKNITIAGGADLIDDILRLKTKGAVLLTGLNHVEVIHAAKKAGVEAIVLVRGKKPEEHVIEAAKEHNMPLLSTHFSLFVACGRLYMTGLRGLDGSW